jgi:hypothetical protein
MDDFSKRDIFVVMAAIVIIVPLTVWLTFAALDHFLILSDLNDPLTKAGGLKTEPQLQVK